MSTHRRAVGAIWWAVGLVLLGGSLVAARGEEAPVLFLTPAEGPVAQVTAALQERLGRTGDAGMALAELPAQLPPAGVLLTDDAHLADEATRTRLLEWVRQGGGVVLLVEPSDDHYAQATAFLQPLGVTVSALPAGGENSLVLGDNAITGGLTLAHPATVRMKITGAGVRPLATIGQEVALAQIPVDKGNVIVLPASLVVAAVRERLPDETPLTMALRAVWWANRSEGPPPETPTAPSTAPVPPQPPPPLPPPAPTTLPLESKDFSGAVLYDCRAVDDSWPQINDLVQALLKEQGLTTKALDVKPGANSLVAALASEPKLAVLGTWRKLGEPETVAVYYYLLGGGRVLALASPSTSTQVRLTYLNEACRPLGVVFSLGRQGGPATLPPSPLHDQMRVPPALPPGIAVVGDGGTDVIQVANVSVMTLLRPGRGRLLALDAGPLPAGVEYRDDLREGIRWLLSEDN